VSTLPTSGKAEPFEWQTVRAEIAGVAASVPVHEGQQVPAGAVLASISDPSLQADISAAEAKLAEAQAALSGAEAGARPAEKTEIANSIERVRLDLQQQQRERDTLERLAAKNAATAAEVTAARDKVRQLEVELAGLQKRQGSLVSSSDVEAAKARVLEIQSALKLARERAARGAVRSPSPVPSTSSPRAPERI
jgi:multidrug resistance efflux pump